MRIVSYRAAEGATRLGIMTEDGLREAGAFPDSPEAFGRLASALPQPGAPVPEDWTPAIPLVPGARVICIGLNYAEHAREGGREPPEYPGLFLRVDTSLAANGGVVRMPASSDRMDWEAELLVVIGKGGRAIPESRALDHVFGYGVFNDISIRDFQRRGAQWTPGKNFDGTGVTGEEIVTADALPPGAKGLGIRAVLNGEVMQDGNTDMMIFPVAKAIATISEFMTLKPGDLIATGTPSGVGFARNPPVFMKPGDEIVIEIDQVGRLRSTIGS